MLLLNVINGYVTAHAMQVPNAGHKAVADLESRLTGQGRSVTVVTQNIDRLHHKAGSKNIIEMHGMPLCVSFVLFTCTVLLLTGYVYMYSGTSVGISGCNKEVAALYKDENKILCY